MTTIKFTPQPNTIFQSDGLVYGAKELESFSDLEGALQSTKFETVHGNNAILVLDEDAGLKGKAQNPFSRALCEYLGINPIPFYGNVALLKGQKAEDLLG